MLWFVMDAHKTRVFLVGVGPGDPELITVKATRLIQTADVILYDYLVHPTIIMMAHDATCICVGKKKGAHSTTQSNINQMMVDLVRSGHTVVRLKGGDPMIFGRLGEEMAVLEQHGIRFEVVPGVTSAIAAPTYAGIPLTHRDASHSVAFVTATRANDIQNLMFPNADTLVILMALFRLDAIVQRMTTLRGADTPIAVIQSGTNADQRVVCGTVGTILLHQDIASLKPPALVVVGEVVTKRHHWRRHLPLVGGRLVVTRAVHQASPLTDALMMLGADVVQWPLNRIDYNDHALDGINMDHVTVMVFSSHNGVVGFVRALAKQSRDIRTLHTVTIVAIGAKTAQALQDYGIQPDIMPIEPTMMGIRDCLMDHLGPADHILVPTSNQSDRVLKSDQHMLARVTYVDAYNNTVPTSFDPHQWVQPSDQFIFMNAASVYRCYDRYPSLANHRVFSIGPSTTSALMTVGVRTPITADQASVDGIIRAILNHKLVNPFV